MRVTLRFTDIFVIAFLFFFFASKFLTAYYIKITVDYCGNLSGAQNMVEANPVTRYIIGLQGVREMILGMIFPGAILSLYAVYRLGYFNIKSRDMNMIIAWVLVLLALMFFLNFMNDLIVVIATYVAYS